MTKVPGFDYPAICGFEEINARLGRSEHSQQSSLIMWIARANAPNVKWQWFQQEQREIAQDVWINLYGERYIGKETRRYISRSTCAVMKSIFAIPNGGLRDPITSSRLKAEGVKGAIPDLMLPYPRIGARAYCGLFVEMKRPRTVKAGKRKAEVTAQEAGKSTSEQEAMHALLRERSYAVIVCQTFLEAMNGIVDYVDG